MKAKDYSIIHCKDGNLYINRSLWTEFRSDDSKRFSEEDLKSIESWIKQTNEYVRKDAFIEKAANYIKKDMLDNLAFQGRLKRIEIIDGIIEKFIKAMKGE